MQKGKEVFWRIVEALILTIVPLALSASFQFISIESVLINIAPSFKVADKYVTEITIQNLKNSTLPEMSLYMDMEISNVEADDSIIQDSQYIKLSKLTPNNQYGMLVWSQEPIHKGDIVVEAQYKSHLSYSEDDSSFWGRIGRDLIIYGVSLFITCIIQLNLTAYGHNKIRKEIEKSCAEDKKELEKEQKLLNTLEQKIAKARKERAELRLYYIAHISDLRKELNFWKDTVRKLLYESKEKVQTADNVMDTITSTLKTYTVRRCNEDNFDEIMYIAEHLSRDREISNAKNDEKIE